MSETRPATYEELLDLLKDAKAEVERLRRDVEIQDETIDKLDDRIERLKANPARETELLRKIIRKTRSSVIVNEHAHGWRVNVIHYIDNEYRTVALEHGTLADALNQLLEVLEGE